MLVMGFFGAPVPLVLMGWFTFAAPHFVVMFADFGAALPAVTILVLQGWWGPAMIVAYLVSIPLVFAFRSNVARDFALVSVVIGGLLAVMASAALLYLPIFQMWQIR